MVQSYFLGNGLGSTEALTDGLGSVTATYKYDVFGVLRASSGTGSSEYRFTGQQDDATLGYTYLRARYYDPQTGRFISKDPFPGVLSNPATLDQYAYTQNDPTNAVDPSGKCGAACVGLAAFGGLAIGDAVAGLAGAAAAVVASPVVIIVGGIAVVAVGGYLVWDRLRSDQTDAAGSCAIDDSSTALSRRSRLQSDPSAIGPHTTFRRDPVTGRITSYEEWAPKESQHPNDPYPWESRKRYDEQGGSHFNKETGQPVPVPHVHDPETPGGVRPAEPDEIPN